MRLLVEREGTLEGTVGLRHLLLFGFVIN